MCNTGPGGDFVQLYLHGYFVDRYRYIFYHWRMVAITRHQLWRVSSTNRYYTCTVWFRAGPVQFPNVASSKPNWFIDVFTTKVVISTLTTRQYGKNTALAMHLDILHQ